MRLCLLDTNKKWKMNKVLSKILTKKFNLEPKLLLQLKKRTIKDINYLRKPTD